MNTHDFIELLNTNSCPCCGDTLESGITNDLCKICIEELEKQKVIKNEHKKNEKIYFVYFLDFLRRYTQRGKQKAGAKIRPRLLRALYGR